MNANYLIVVGVDGSEGGRRAADLLVLGSHGHSRVRHTVLGSVSEDCIRKASCPVVVIPVPVERSERASEPAVRS